MRAVIGRHYRRRERGKDRNASRWLAAALLHRRHGPTLVLIHTVRTQLDLLPASDSGAGGHYTVYAACEALSITRWHVLNSQL
jgi:hypothetical protein